MIAVTGAAGFIGSCLVSRLNSAGITDIAIVDDFASDAKLQNLLGRSYMQAVHRDQFAQWLDNNHNIVEFVFHIGARTDTTEFDKRVFDKLNLDYSVRVWQLCTKYRIPLVYASSAATYGLGEFGYSDAHDLIHQLVPLNPYGESKNDFDKWVLTQKLQPPYWAGLKFFNVYGPNEYHKGRMASVIFHAFNQIRETGKMKLFRSHNPHFKDGEQLRDFVYVKDVVEVCMFLMKHKKASGIYNLGSGRARTFIDLVKSTFSAMGKEPVIEFTDTPADIRDKYQYYTQADMTKLRSIGYSKPFYELEEGVTDYVQNYLQGTRYY
jgi:ADP-L-glycero-D-manno-heptose 6-epimerase